MLGIICDFCQTTRLLLYAFMPCSVIKSMLTFYVWTESGRSCRKAWRDGILLWRHATLSVTCCGEHDKSLQRNRKKKFVGNCHGAHVTWSSCRQQLPLPLVRSAVDDDRTKRRRSLLFISCLQPFNIRTYNTHLALFKNIILLIKYFTCAQKWWVANLI